MTGIKAIYRSDKAEVIRAFTTAVDKRRTWGDQIITLIKEIDPERQPVTTQGFGVPRLAGMSHDGGTPPEGWRIVRPKDGPLYEYIVPKVSTKIGKAVAKRLDEVGPAPDVRGALPGMPRHTRMFGSPGVRLLEDGKAVYVTWGSDPDGEVDGSLWERVPRSRYYLAVEAEDGDEAVRS